VPPYGISDRALLVKHSLPEGEASFEPSGRRSGASEPTRRRTCPCSGRASTALDRGGVRLPRKSRALLSTSCLPHAHWRTAVKGGAAVPKGREDRRRSAAEPRTAAPLRAGRRRATWRREGRSSQLAFVVNLVRRGWGHSGTLHQCPKVGGACRRAGCRASLRAARGAWWGAATARRVQSLSRRRHRSGSHAVTRTRALAVPDPAHPASPTRSRQRIWPSRRP
jgi:hypothetical protein